MIGIVYWPSIVITIKILLLGNFYTCHSQDVNFPCQTDEDCNGWLSCVNNTCTACAKIGSSCQKNGSGYLSNCCPSTTCEHVIGLSATLCMPLNNNCLTDKDCEQTGLQCLMRVGKCGACHPDGTKCTLPYDSIECCSNYCKIIDNVGNAICADPSKYKDDGSLISLKQPPKKYISFLDALKKSKSNHDLVSDAVRQVFKSKGVGGIWPNLNNQNIKVKKRRRRFPSKICTVTYNCDEDCADSRCPGCKLLHMTCDEDMLHH